MIDRVLISTGWFIPYKIHAVHLYHLRHISTGMLEELRFRISCELRRSYTIASDEHPRHSPHGRRRPL